MKRKIVRFLIIWVAMFVVLFVLCGILFASYFSNNIEPTYIEKYDTKIGYFVNPEAAIAENGIKDASAIIVLNTAMNDWCSNGESEIPQIVNLVESRALVDREGNALISGIYAAVTEKRSDLTMISNHKEELIIGYMPISDYFDSDLIYLLDKLCEDNEDVAVSVDSYGKDGMCYYPIHVTLWEGDSKIDEYDCLYDGIAATGEAIWISSPADIDWINVVELDESRESLKDWCVTHTDLLFSDKNAYSCSGLFSGFEKYSIVNNGEVALVMRAVLDGRLLMKTMFGGISLGTFFIALVLSGIIAFVERICKKKKSE